MLSGISKPVTPVGGESKQGKRRQGEILGERGAGLAPGDLEGAAS